MSEKTVYLVFSNAVEGKDKEFNEWYETIHVPEVLATPGLISAQRFSFAENEMSRALGTEPTHRYLAVYEMEGDPDIVMGKIRDAVEAGEMVMSDLLALDTVAMSFWKPMGPRIEA
jgi:hypothetical protein